jgi:hypothetical protein
MVYGEWFQAHHKRYTIHHPHKNIGSLIAGLSIITLSFEEKTGPIIHCADKEPEEYIFPGKILPERDHISQKLLAGSRFQKFLQQDHRL